MKIKLAVSLALTAFLLFAGCGPADNTDKTDNLGIKKPETPEYVLVEDMGELPQVTRDLVQELKTQKGYFPLLSPESSGNGQDCLLLISSGKKPTGGYSIALKSLEIENGVADILVEEKEPERDKGVIQIITYPFIILKIDGNCENYRIKNTDGEVFTKIIIDKKP